MRLMKLLCMPFALAVLGAALLLPGAAQAKTSSASLSVSSVAFPSGTALTGALSGTIPVPRGATVKLTAPKFVYEAPTPPAIQPTEYEFMFWDANSTLVRTEKATFKAAAGTAFDAIAWYLPIGGGPCPTVCPPAATTWAYSLTDHKVLPGTPIASVTPAAAWTAPSTAVSTATAVTIAAQPLLGVRTPPTPKTAGNKFQSWFVFPPGGATTSGVYLKVGAGESPYAIAFYKYYTPPMKPPCIGYPHCM